MRETLAEAIESLLACQYREREIIVVDDGSTDGTPDYVQTKYPSVRLIKSSAKGISSARDLGWRSACGPIVAFTDADCKVSSDWMKRIASHFSSDPKLAAVGGKTIFSIGEDIASKCRNIEFERRYSQVPEDTVSAMGPNSAFRKSYLELAGGFDPSWKFGEDAEACYNIAKLGGRIVFDKELIVYHVPEQGLRRYLRKRLRDAAAYVRVAKDHPVFAFGGDKFITKNMIFQPFLFGILLLSLVVSIFEPILLWVSLPCFGLLWFLNVGEAFDVYRLNHRLRDFFSALSLLFLRGCIWGTGLLIGVKHVMLRQQ